MFSIEQTVAMQKEAKEKGVVIGGIGPIGQLTKDGKPVTFGEINKTPDKPVTDPPKPDAEEDGDLAKLLADVEDSEVDSTIAELDAIKAKLLARKKK